MADAPIILWFRNDLRLGDHPALSAAVATGRPVVPVFILDDEAAGRWARGGASRWWLHHSLTSLSRDLATAGAPLVLRRGATRKIIADIAREADATAVYCSRGYEPWAIQLEGAVRDEAVARGSEFKRFAGPLLFEPDAVRTKTGEPYKVYSPFWRAATATPPRAPLPRPKHVRGLAASPKSDDLADWQLLPTKPDWAAGFRSAWQPGPGEAGAETRLGRFLDEGLAGYGDLRNRPDLHATSRLSPYLHFGEISPAQCWHAARLAAEARPAAEKGAEVFCKELAWREFSYHLLFNWPTLPDVPFRPEFKDFPWRSDERALRAWQTGHTGFPIVDAGMRELWTTGWMHNRVRMIVASFLIKDLLVPWQAGEAWFWDCLVDADLASNAASWQWVAGSGADAAPYFRIFNPMKQGETFDPNGDYVRRWVPELAHLPADVIHQPRAGGLALDDRGAYPRPLVDHAMARDRALAAFARIKS
jgi:deoxyribodipyrimidine photo-lyase